jgi:hypothetical protein
MTEKEWLTWTDPRAMLDFFAHQWSDRKLRLFGLDCCQLIARRLDDRGRRALETAERYAEGLATPDELEVAREAANDAFVEFDDSTPCGPNNECGWESAANAVESLCHRDGLTNLIAEITRESAVVRAGHPPPPLVRVMLRRAFTEQCRVLRDIFGNPFRPVAFDPRWRTADTVALAHGIYDERAFDRLPLLADALADAGCADEQVIGHCCSKDPHVRGCWVVDLVLGKE